MTPKFIQITCSSSSGGSFSSAIDHLYGLTVDGEVYEWQKVYENALEYHREWVKLINPSQQEQR